MRSSIADNLHQEVSTALSNINILSEMARLKADNEPEKSKEFIEQIHSRSQNMMIAMDDMLWSISPENDSMNKTILRMKEFVEGMNNHHGSDIEMLVEEKVKMLNLNMQLRHDAFILFKECLQGLLKAGATDNKIHVTFDRGFLLYDIEFMNNCCDMQQITYGLQSREMQRRIDTIKAMLNVEVHKKNTVLSLKIPAN
jgi:signal transduction histidine kinase